MTKTACPVASLLTEHRPNVLPLKGEIDLHFSAAITESLDTMIDEKPEHIVIDLSGATYIDSAGLAALILAMQKLEGLGGKFLLSGLNQTLISIFETSRLNRIFRICPDVHAALAAI